MAARKRLLAPILVAVIVSLAAVLVAWRIAEEREDPTYLCSYTLLISSTDEELYTVCVPIPCTYKSGTPPDGFVGQVTVSGDANVAVVDTPYGHALSVSGTGHTEVNWTSDSSGHGTGLGYYPNITMLVEAEDGSRYDWHAWMSSDKENTTAYLNYSTTYRWYPSPFSLPGGSDREYAFEMTPGEEGWRLVECDFEMTVIN